MNKDLKLVPKKVKAKYKIKNKKKMFSVKTKTGKEIKLTFDHKLPILKQDGTIIWERICNLNKGDYIATPRRLTVQQNEINPISLFDPSELYVSICTNFTEKTSLPDSANLAFTSSKLSELNKTNWQFIKRIRYGGTGSPKYINLPILNEGIMYCAGLIRSDGHIRIKKRTNNIAFTNKEEKLHKLFNEVINSNFGVNVRRERNNLTSAVSNRTLCHLFTKVFSILPSFSEKKIAAFIKGFFDGDGSIKRRKRDYKINIATARKEEAKLMQTLLLRLGIISKIDETKSRLSKLPRGEYVISKPQHNIVINNLENIYRFIELVGSEHPKKKRIMEEIKRASKKSFFRDIISVPVLFKELRKELGLTKKNFSIGPNISFYERGEYRFTRKTLLRLYSDFLKIKTGQNEKVGLLKRLVESDIFWDEIKEIKKIEKENYVYDLTIEGNHNFVAENMVIHNSVLAAANPKFGRFNPHETVASQINLPPTLINRFDVIFVIKDIPDRAKDEAIATHVLMEHQSRGEGSAIDRNLLKKYIAYAKQKIAPKLTDAAIDEIKKFYVDLRNTQVSIDQPQKPIPISARQLEALIRMSEANAKSRLSQKVTKDDAKNAIELMKYYLMRVGYDYETKTFDIDRIATGFSTSERSKIMTVKETLARLESRLGKLIPIEEIKKELDKKVNEKDIDEVIDKLTISGDIFHPRKGFVQRL